MPKAMYSLKIKWFEIKSESNPPIINHTMIDEIKYIPNHFKNVAKNCFIVIIVFEL
jgi:hypothetical protein